MCDGEREEREREWVREKERDERRRLEWERECKRWESESRREWEMRIGDVIQKRVGEWWEREKSERERESVIVVGIGGVGKNNFQSKLILIFN